MGKLSRTKGHSFERQVAIALREVYPDAKRQLEYQIDTCQGIDLVNTGPYRIQCKRMRKYAPLSAITEVLCDEMLGEVPVLITAGDRSRALACIPLEEFIRLLKNQRDQ